MIVGIGTDIAEISRIEATLAKHGERFVRRVLTPQECAQFSTVTAKTAWLAKRFAAKEAAAKALGTGIGEGVSWQHIEVVNDALGAPKLRLYEVAQARADAIHAARFHLSLSDERDYALAFVILES
ncbi:Phosphopantetheinyl transferase (holo-ACP synthase) [gamma proteobacterium HdN1]|nr:Phosphopantetheinyl transferase (holo-ACP synthase) [gamma proteobacterium HdN1]